MQRVSPFHHTLINNKLTQRVNSCHCELVAVVEQRLLSALLRRALLAPPWPLALCSSSSSSDCAPVSSLDHHDQMTCSRLQRERERKRERERERERFRFIHVHATIIINTRNSSDPIKMSQICKLESYLISRQRTASRQVASHHLSVSSMHMYEHAIARCTHSRDEGVGVKG